METKMNFNIFYQKSNNISTIEIYKNLANLKCENDEFELFKEYLPVLMKQTYVFLHSLESNEIFFAKQAYEYLKNFVKNADKEIIECEKFKEFIHQWENTVNFYFLFMPSESFIINGTNDVPNNVEINQESTSKLQIFDFRISKFKKGNDNSANNHDNLSKGTKKFHVNQHFLNQADAHEINTTFSPLQVYVDGLKLLLLALKKHNKIKPETKMLMEKINTLNDILILETDIIDDSPIYSIIRLLLFQNDDAQISTKHLVSQRSKISLMRHFCVFYQIKKYIKADQMNMFVLYTNAGVDSSISDFFSIVHKNVIFPLRFYQKNSLEYALLKEKSSSIYQILKNSTNMDYLVNDLLKHIINNKKITLNDPLLALYRTALLREKVIEIGKSNSKFSAAFLHNCELLSNEASNFRQQLIKKIKETQKIGENGALEFMKNTCFVLSDTFSKDQISPSYTDFKIFSKETNVNQEIDLFFEKFVLTVKQPYETQLNEVIECELGKNFSLFDAEFISQNNIENIQSIVKEYQDESREKIYLEIVQKHMQKIQRQITSSLMDPLVTTLSSNFEKTLEGFFNSNKLILVISTSLPFFTVMKVKKYVSNFIFITFSQLQSVLISKTFDVLLQKNNLIIKIDKKTKNVKPEDLLPLYEYLNKKNKTKALILVFKDNSLVTTKSDINDEEAKIKISETLKTHIPIEFNDYEYGYKIDDDNNDLHHFTKKIVNFQNKEIMINDLIMESEELITPDLTEKLFTNEEIILGKYVDFCGNFNEETYVSRRLWQNDGYSNESYSEMDLLDLNKKSVIIVGSAGMGKTVLLTKLSEKINENMSWLVTIDLRRYCNMLDNIEFYNNNENEIFFYNSDGPNIDFGKVLLRSLLTEPDKTDLIPDETLDFEKKLFQHYFYEEKLCVIVDGFGEIPKRHHKKLLHFFERIGRGTDNKLIISTTHDFAHILESNLGVKSYILKPFTEKEREEFVNKCWEIYRHTSGSAEYFHEYYKYFTIETVFQTKVLEPNSPLHTWITATLWLFYKKKKTYSTVNKKMQIALLTPLFPKAFRSNNKKYANMWHVIFDHLHISLSIETPQISHLKIYYKMYQQIAIKHLLNDSELQLKIFLKTSCEHFDRDIFDNLDDFLFLSKLNGDLTFTHSIFAEYFAANFLINNLRYSTLRGCVKEQIRFTKEDGVFFEIINFLLKRTSKDFSYFIFELFANELFQERKSEFFEDVLRYSVSKNYKNIVKCLITNTHKFFTSEMSNDCVKNLLKIAVESKHMSFLDILLQPYTLTLNEEHLTRQNTFLKLKLSEYTFDLIDDMFFKSNDNECLKRLILASKKIPITPDELENATDEFKKFVYSVGFLYDFEWVKQSMSCIKNHFHDYFEDYSLTTYFDKKMQISSVQSKTPRYTQLDLINKSDYYNDEEKLEITKSCIDAGYVEATWSYEKQDFDKNCSYITCILQAAIAHGHFITFEHFLVEEKQENYYLHLLTAAKFSQNPIIQYLLENHKEKLISNKDDSFFQFLELFSNEEMKSDIALHFPVFTQKFENQFRLLKTAIHVNAKFVLIKTLAEQCEYVTPDMAQKLVKYSLDVKRLDVASYFNSKFHLEISEAFVTLHNTVKTGNESLSAEILNDVNINEKDDNGNTPLHYAGNNVEMIRLLLENGAIYNSLNNDFKIPIDYVCATTDASDLLKEVDAAFRLHIGSYNEKNVTAIFNARNFKKLSLMHAVLEEGDNTKIKEVIEMYVNKCKKSLPIIINSKDLNDNKPLHIAIKENNFSVFKKLLEYGALFDKRAKGLISSATNNEFKVFLQTFHYACTYFDAFLKEQREDVAFYLECKDENGKTPVHYAAEKCELNEETIKKITELNVNLNIADFLTPKGLTKEEDIYEQYFVPVKAGKKLNTDLTTLDNDEFCHIYNMCEKRSKIKNDRNVEKNFKMLLLANVRDKDENTLLHYAVKQKEYEVVLFLLHHGIPYNIKNKYGNSAEDLTTNATVKSLLKAIKDLFYAVESKKTIFLTQKATHVLTKDYFLNKKLLPKEYIKNIILNARKRICDENKYNVCTLLHQTAKYGKLDIVRWLIINGTNPEETDFYGQTALEIAKKTKHKDVCCFLERYGGTINVGVYPAEGKLSYCNELDKTTIDLNIVETWEIEKVGFMFEEIKSKIVGKFGYLCFCLCNRYGNRIRKKFIELGLKNGFKNVEIINSERTIYTYLMSSINYKPSNGNVIWINDTSFFHVWQIIDQKAKFIGDWKVTFSELIDLKKLVNDSKVNKGPDIVLYKDKIEKTNIKLLSPNCQFFSYVWLAYWQSRGCLLKAQMAAGDCNLSHVDTVHFLSQDIILKLGDAEIAKYKDGHPLPLIFSYEINKESYGEKLQITTGNGKMELLEIQKHNKILLTFEIDQNEIFSWSFGMLSAIKHNPQKNVEIQNSSK